MKFVAFIVAGLFIVGGGFIPSVKASLEPPTTAKTYADEHPIVNTKLQTIAREEYTISYYQDYIFSHESGWHTNSINSSSGACGLGQAWPCSKMPCALSQAGFDCQMNFFNTYAMNRFGSWENAYNYWVSHHNW